MNYFPKILWSFCLILKNLAFLSRYIAHTRARQANYHNTLPLLVFPNPLYEIIFISHTLLRGIQSVWTKLNSLCQGPIQWACNKIWSTISPLSMLKPRLLFHLHFLIHISLQKDIFQIQLIRYSGKIHNKKY